MSITGSIALFQLLRKGRKASSKSGTRLDHIEISILKPLKGVDASLEGNLRSFFEAHTITSRSMEFELLFSIESESDPAFPLVQRLMAEYPNIQSGLFFSKRSWVYYRDLGANPKLKNIAKSYHQAKYDLVLISDSNVRLQPGDLEDLVRSSLEPNVGMVTSIVAGTHDEGLGGYLEALYLNTFYARMMAFSNRFAKPCVVGKSMLFRKSVAERFGGLKILSQFLAEDFMAGESMAKLGLKIATAGHPVNQIIGPYSFKQFWGRHLRWGRIRRAHVPLAYVFEPLSFPIVILPLLAYSLSRIGIAPAWALAALLTWFALDLAQFATLRRKLESKHVLFAVAWLLREVVALPLWVCIALNDRIEWRGNELKLLPGGRLES